MNVMLTDFCNLKCKYCFASCETDVKKRQEISDESYRYILDFLKRSNHRGLRLLGGEPTLHKKFEKYVTDAIQDAFFANIHIFTNALHLNKEMSHAIAHEKTSFLINLNSPQDLGDKLYAQTIENIEYLVSEYRMRNIRPQVVLGINIYSPDLDYKYIIEESNRLGLEVIRYSITTPQTFNTDIDLDFYRQYADYLANFVDDCANHGILSHIDCNNPPKCVFTPNQLMKLIVNESDIMNHQQCNPVLDIRPDLTIARCFVFNDYINVNLKDFRDERELLRFFTERIDRHRFDIPTFKTCQSCEFNNKCQGGCLGYKKFKNLIHIR